VYKIGDFSRLSQIPVKTLRHYADMGLLRPAYVDRQTGYRYYTAAQLEQLNRILVFKDLGFSLKEICLVIGANVPIPQIRRLLELKRDEVEGRVAGERARLGRVAARLDALDRCRRPPALEVAVRRVGARLVASTRGVLRSYDESERLFAELERSLDPEAVLNDRAAVWHSGHGAIDCEALVFLRRPVVPVEGIRVWRMPAHTAACLVYRGSEDAPAFAALSEWLTLTGSAIAGVKREIYLDAGGRDGDSVTEIQYPIAMPIDHDTERNG
jgi:DNA-binding transcriptional MerR regulator